MSGIADIISACGYALADKHGAALGQIWREMRHYAILKEERRAHGRLLRLLRHRRRRRLLIARLSEQGGFWLLGVYGRRFVPEMEELAARLAAEARVRCEVRLSNEGPHFESLPDFTC